MLILNSLVYPALAVYVLMVFVWFISLLKKDASIVDVFWGPAFIVQTIVYCFHYSFENFRLNLLSVLILFWGLRLSIHIFIRNKGKDEDYRYQAMRKKHGKRFWWYSLFIFFFQGLLAIIVMLPVHFIALSGINIKIGIFDYIGLVLWWLGFLIESISDYQLSRFKRNPSNKSKLMTKGLWSISRHPNYFGDSLVWWGVFCFSLSLSYYALFTALGPLLMLFLLLKVSGVPLLEKKLAAEKNDYTRYINITPSFFPNLIKLFLK